MNFIKKILSFFINFIFSFFKVKDNKIILEAGRGLIDGNVKSIYKYIIENNLNYKVIWLVDKKTDLSEIGKNDYAYYKTLRCYYHMATAKYWIKNQSIGSLLKKKKNQIYIQVFHGNGVFKKMGYDVNNAKERPELDHVKEWDYYAANDENEANVIRSSTGYKGKIKVLGMSCTENVIRASQDKNTKNKVFEILNVEENLRKNKVILYAPTFRDFDLDKDVVNVPIEKLANLNGYTVIVRLHPLVREKVDKNIFKNKNIINGCEYSDCSELLAISDILITDYSSIFYEFLPLNLPIIFYPYDYDKYVELRGGFYIDYKNELPGPICYNQKELLDNIINIENIEKENLEKRKKFNEKYNKYSDGKATERFVNELKNKKFN